MIWQLDLQRDILARLPSTATARIAGSVLTPHLVDGWSDLDLHITLHHDISLNVIAGSHGVWAMDEGSTTLSQVLRIVLEDGRRLDLVVEGPGRVNIPPLSEANDFRFVAAMAVVKLGRNDRLIGSHLVFELFRLCLVQAMQLRDRDCGTEVHRQGSSRDAMADEITKLAACTFDLTPRPNIVERTASLYDRWRNELHPNYEPNGSGLNALLERGLSRA